MRANEIKFGKALQDAWNIFLRAPEVFTVLTLGCIFVYYVFAFIPVAGYIINLLVTPLAYSAIFLLAEHDRKHGKADFSALKELGTFIPQLVMTALISKILISLGLILLIIPGLYLAVCYQFSQLFVVFEGKTFWEAMEASRKMVQTNWFGMFGFWLFYLILFGSGLLLAGIGILLTAPLATLMLYCAFRQLRGETVAG